MAIKWTQAGEMRKRITIQLPSTAPTESGETTGETEAVCTVWAKVKPLGGREAWLAQAQQSTSTHKINIRYYPGITPAMQAVIGSRVFNFTSVNDIGEVHRELEIMATEVVA